MRALSCLMLAGAVALGGSVLAPATAEAYGGWRGRDYYRGYVPPAFGLRSYGLPGYPPPYATPYLYGPNYPGFPGFYGAPGFPGFPGFPSYPGLHGSYGFPGFPGYHPGFYSGLGHPGFPGYHPGFRRAPGLYVAPRSYGIPPGPGLGLWIR